MEKLKKEFELGNLNPPKELGIPPKTTNLEVWNVIDLYFRERGLVYHKLEPYDLFLENVKDIVRTRAPIMAEDRKSQGVYQYTFGNVSLIPPSFTPQEARLRNMDYHITAVANITQGFTSSLGTHTQKVFPNQKIGEIPLMLKSKYCCLNQQTPEEMISYGECDNDIGGYYIINGKERCIVAQERIEYNRIYVWQPQKAPEKKNYKMMAEIRCVVIRGTKPAVTKIYIEPNGNVVCMLSGLKEEIQVGTIIHALGASCGWWRIDSDSSSEIKKLIIGEDTEDEKLEEVVDKILYTSRSGRNAASIDIIGGAANASIAKDQRPEFVEQLLQKEMLLHICLRNKPVFLAYMIRRLIDVFLKRRAEDDRDHFANKRCDTDGKLLEDLFRGFFDKYVENVTAKLASHPNNVSVFERDTTITQGIHHCMSTGNWGIQKIGFQKVGVCQLMTRLNYSSALSHLRRVSSNRSVESRAMKLRQLHGSQWGIFDPAETPEGKNSGILKNLSVAGHLTSATSESPILDVLANAKSFEKDLTVDNCGFPKVFLNGSMIGICKIPGYLLAHLRELRQAGILHHDTSISYRTKELHIYCDSGRCSRPLFAVKNGKLVISQEEMVSADSWHSLIAKGLIQYVDTVEEQTSLISTFANQLLSKSQYCEIHPALILGVCCSVIPWPGCNQGPRNSYSGSMTKQAMGIFVHNFLQRFETSAYILHYPERPLVVPRMSKYFAYSELASGVNAIVAIMAFGWNQEDSVILNKAAVERGLFSITAYKTYTAEEKNQENQTIETIEAPIDQKGLDRTKNYLKLDDQGIIRERSIVNKNDIIIRKTIRRDGKASDRLDASIVHKIDEVGFVDKVLITKNAEGNKLVKVRIGFIRLPIMGDKFASVHAQKGTCGAIWNQEDLPRTAAGIVPDIIINPHAIPSRMTIAHLIECLTGKMAVVTGEFQDATPFADSESNMLQHIEQVGSALHAHGYESHGEEAMYSGITGKLLGLEEDEPLEALEKKSETPEEEVIPKKPKQPTWATIFIGPTYYRRLKHMVIDKLSARADGPVQTYTRQPANHGRKSGTEFTSVRFGTMESDAMASHGSAELLRERLFLSSDKYQTNVCNHCGMICVDQEVQGCKCDAGTTMTSMPYVFKLIHHNITALQIKASIRTDASTRTI